MDLIEKLAGNKAIANLVFGKLKKFIKEENITMICLYVDNDNNIAAKQYEKPVVVLSQEDAVMLLNSHKELQDFKLSHPNVIEDWKQKTITDGTE